MKKLSLGMLIVMMMAFIGLNAAVIQVAAGTDGITTALDGAAEGDVIELTTDGGIYQESNKLYIKKSISIVAAEGLTTKPILRSDAGGTEMIKIEADSGRVELIGFEMDGTNGGTSASSKYMFIVRNDTLLSKLDVFVDDVVGHDSQEALVKCYGTSSANSITIVNSVFSDAGKEGLMFYEGSSSKPNFELNELTIENTTVYNTEREAIKAESIDPTVLNTNVLINHVTVFNAGSAQNKPMVRFRRIGNVEIKNSVFAHNDNTDLSEEFMDLDDEVNSTFHHSLVWDLLNMGSNGVVVTDTLRADPMFVDTANYDFSLAIGSPALTLAEDGGPVGDLRWAPAPTVHQISAGTDKIAAALDAAEAGDVIELTTDGGVYQETNKPYIKKSITIAAASDMVNKPIIRSDAAGTEMIKIEADFGVVNLVGVELDGSNGTGSASSKYAFIVRNDTLARGLTINVEDVYAHHSAEALVKCYALSSADQINISKSIFHDAGKEGLMFYEGSSSKPNFELNEINIDNVTLYNIEREGIKAEAIDGTTLDTKVRVNKVTMFRVGVAQNKPMLRFKRIGDVEVKNSIFAHSHNTDTGEEFMDLDDAVNSTFHHSAVWDLLNSGVNGAVVSDTAHINPMFADTNNYDFSLADDSELLTFGDDGGAVGDNRWVPGGADGFLLKVEVSGEGSVAKDPDQARYAEGTDVTLTATPANDNWKFVAWSDNVPAFPPDNPTVTVSVMGNILVTAFFEPVVPKFEEVVIGAVGLGHVDTLRFSDYAVPGFFEGDSIILSATPDTSTWIFDHWANADGKNISTDNPLTWIADGDSTWIAMFKSTITQYTFTDSVIGLGSFTVSPQPVPGFSSYDDGTELTLEVEPAVGWEFAGWGGDLSGTADSMTVTLTANTLAIAEFTAIEVPNGDLMVDAAWDLRDVVDFAKYNPNVERVVLTQVGPYEATEDMRESGDLPNMDIDFSLTIVGSDTISNGKATIKAWGEGSSEGMFRLRTDGHLTLENVFLDGFASNDNPTKYLFRVDDGDSLHASLKARDCDMRGSKEVFFKTYALTHIDTFILDNCTVWEIGKEGVYDNGAGTFYEVEITNSTFYDFGREVLRFKKPENNANVLIDHVTVDSTGHGYGTDPWKHAAFKFENPATVVISNTIISNVLNSEYGYGIRLNSENAIVENTLLYNTAPIDLDDGAMIGEDVLWGDPMFVDAAAMDFTLKDSSAAYHMANDGEAAIGDLKWATSSNVADYSALDVMVDGPGMVEIDPLPYAKFFVPGSEVTLTAVADSLAELLAWSGDASGSVATVVLIMDADKMVAAEFHTPEWLVTLEVNMRYWAFLGKFDPAEDFVDVAGEMNDWDGTDWVLEDADGDSTYALDFTVPALAPTNTYAFKFRINGSWDDATAEFPSGGPDRSITINSDTTFTFWYNDEEWPVGINDMIPMEYSLNQNYPNPFNPVTTIEFALKESGHTKLVVFDVLGREIATLVNREMQTGYYDISVQADRLSSGVYFYQITSGDFISVKKMMVLK